MPPAKDKSAAAANGKPKAEKPAPSTSGTATPVADKDGAGPSFGKPDKVAYDAEQDGLRKEIDALQAKLNTVKEKIANGGKGGPAEERRKVLRTELDGLRGQQATGKASRGKVLDQVKALNDNIAKKVKDLNAAKGKIPYRSVQEIDERVKQLDKQIESGSMKLADEKRALQDMSKAKGFRRTLETYQKDQESIEADRASVDALRKQLDDPESKALSDRYDAIKSELDALKKEADDAYASRNKLYDERTAIQGQLDTLFNAKRESVAKYRDANDRYWVKVNEDRARRAERARTERAEQEVEKKKAVAERLREEAEAPAFQAQIEDCQTLIDYFSGKTSAPAAAAALAPKKDVAGVDKHELRKVEAVGENMVALKKKKGEEEEGYFAGKPKKGKGKKGGAKAEPSADDQLNVPLPTLSALLSLSIPPPTSSAELARVVEDLKTKKAWFAANQQRVTAENVAKAEKEIARLTGSKANGDVAPAASTDDIVPVNGGGEKPAEPAHTPQVGDVKSVPVDSEEVVDKLETVVENGDA